MKEYVVVSEVKHVIFEQELNKYAAQGYQVIEYKTTPVTPLHGHLLATFRVVNHSAVMERDVV